MRISDWNSDVCSSDLTETFAAPRRQLAGHAVMLVDLDRVDRGVAAGISLLGHRLGKRILQGSQAIAEKDRKSVVYGKRESVRVNLGGHRISKKKKNEKYT